MINKIICILLFFSINTLRAQNLSDEEKNSNSRSTKSKKNNVDINEFPSKINDGITFMTQNLNVSNFKDGSIIPEAKNANEWIYFLEKKEPAWCYYEYSKKNEKKLGKIYNYYALISDKGLAPEG